MELHSNSKTNIVIDVTRWVAALPAALLSAWLTFLIMRILGRFSLSYAGVEADGFWSQMYETTIAHGIMGGVFVYVGGYVVPNHKIIASMAFAGIAIASTGFLAFPAVLVRDWGAMVGAASICIGAGIMVWSLHAGEINFK